MLTEVKQAEIFNVANKQTHGGRECAGTRKSSQMPNNGRRDKIFFSSATTKNRPNARRCMLNDGGQYSQVFPQKHLPSS
jgi:hypothetical protein